MSPKASFDPSLPLWPRWKEDSLNLCRPRANTRVVPKPNAVGCCPSYDPRLHAIIARQAQQWDVDAEKRPYRIRGGKLDRFVNETPLVFTVFASAGTGVSAKHLCYFEPQAQFQRTHTNLP